MCKKAHKLKCFYQKLQRFNVDNTFMKIIKRLKEIKCCSEKGYNFPFFILAVNEE